MVAIKTYTKEEFLVALGETRSVWERRKEELLDHISDFMLIEIRRGPNNGLLFDVQEIYGEYIKLPRKNGTKVDRISDYKKFAYKEIEARPLNSPRLMAHKAVEDEVLQEKYHHCPDTAVRYLRPILRGEGSRVNVAGSVWAHESNGEYIPLTQEQEKYLRQLFKESFKDCSKTQGDYIADYENGSITKEECDQAISAVAFDCYYNAIGVFIDKYHFKPIKVKLYELNAYEDEN